jgi:hypothetical protein
MFAVEYTKGAVLLYSDADQVSTAFTLMFVLHLDARTMRVVPVDEFISIRQARSPGSR